MVELVDHSCRPEETIAQGAGVCYGKDDKDVSRIKRLKQHKHLATMRFGHAVVKITGISIAAQNQFVRSKMLDYLVQSKRYVDASNNEFIYPKDLPDEAYGLIADSVNMAFDTYQQLLEMGVKKEDARSVLPMNTSTSMYVAGNFQAWMDFLKLRVSKHAQKEIRDIAIEIWGLLLGMSPAVFEDLTFEDKGYEQWVALIS